MARLCFRLLLAVVVSSGVFAGFSKTCEAEQQPMILNKEAFSGKVPVRVRVGIGESQMVESPEVKIKDVSLTEPKVADVVVVSPNKVNLSGKAPGTT
ncbi:MAG TPA: pilus assembly protein N-terminal domain-containing protein, partial [Thermodesulfobacteriota bacterium]|nr:pilus assembly protein N-terminal domain-containing protein [Thermodesulfobacteriota bacterium]